MNRWSLQRLDVLKLGALVGFGLACCFVPTSLMAADANSVEHIAEAAAGATPSAPSPKVLADCFIDFNSDPGGLKPNGWVSDDCADAAFSDSNGANLQVANFGAQNCGGNGLAVFSDFDDSQLIMNFAKDLQAIEIFYGNDDPGWSNPGDVARLTITGGPVINQVMNRNDVCDQAISHSDPANCFSQATFKYVVTGFAGGIIEVVDNISTTNCGVAGGGGTCDLTPIEIKLDRIEPAIDDIKTELIAHDARLAAHATATATALADIEAKLDSQGATLCEIVDLLLTPEKERCVDGECGFGIFPSGLEGAEDPLTCISPGLAGGGTEDFTADFKAHRGR